MRDSSRNSGILLGLCILVLGLFFSHGMYQAYWLWTLPSAAIAILFSEPSKRFDSIIQRFLPSIFLLIAAVSVTRGFGQFGNLQSSEPDREWLVNGFRFLYTMGAVTSYFCLATQKSSRLFFAASVLFVSLGLDLLLFASPRPWIDVWSVQEAATKALLSGKNPYGIEYQNFYPLALQPLLNPFGNPFVYLPGVLYLLTPVKWLALDTRVALILAHAATTFLIGTIPNKRGYFPALVFLSIPFVPYLIDQGWNDSLTVMFIALCAFAISRKSFTWFIVSLIGMLLIKQHVFLITPLLLYFGSQYLRRSPLKALAFCLGGFILGCLPFAIWNWSAFVGSLWGLHALTHSSGAIIPDRQDGFSLLNWLTLNTGFRPYSIFILVGMATLVFGFTALKKSRSVSSLFTLSAVTLLGVFATAPLAFLNYYWVCVSLMICAMSFEERSPLKIWPDDVATFAISRCLLLFSTTFFQSQTTFYNFFAAEKLTSLVPFQAFGYRLMPLAQVPMAAAHYLKAISSAPPLLSFRLYFVVLLVAADFGFYFSVRKRISKSNLYLYIITSTVLFEQFYDHAELWAGLVLAFGLITEIKGWRRSLCAGIAFAFQWTSGGILAVCDLVYRRGVDQLAGLIAVVSVVLAIAFLSPMPIAQFFMRTITEANLASIAHFVPFVNARASDSRLLIPGLAALVVLPALAVRNRFGRSLSATVLVLFTFLVFDPLAGTGALVLVLPCLTLTMNLDNWLAGALLILTCLLRTFEFHGILPSYGASQCSLALTYMVFLFNHDSYSVPRVPSPDNPSLKL